MDFFFPEIRSDVRRTPIENFIEPGQEREHRDAGRRDVADGLREEDREHRVRQEVRQEEEEYAEAQRLLRLFRYVDSLDDESIIAGDSILREFIGGSIYTD